MRRLCVAAVLCAGMGARDWAAGLPSVDLRPIAPACGDGGDGEELSFPLRSLMKHLFLLEFNKICELAIHIPAGGICVFAACW